MTPIHVTHAFVRKLAKNLRARYGKDAKHTDIIADIADAAGRPADALMHELKHANVNTEVTKTPEHGRALAILADLTDEPMSGEVTAAFLADLLEETAEKVDYSDDKLRPKDETRNVHAVMRKAFDSARGTLMVDTPKPGANVFAQATALAKLTYAAVSWAAGHGNGSEPSDPVFDLDDIRKRLRLESVVHLAGAAMRPATEYMPKSIRDLARAYLNSLPGYNVRSGRHQNESAFNRHAEAEFYILTCLTDTEMRERAA
jgi:hypothetical protein